MDVSALLTLMGNLSLGNDNITPTERAIFLQYLNLAHFQLYQVTANFNSDLLFQENLTNEENSNAIPLSQIPYLINNVYDLTHKRRLKHLSLTDVLEQDPAFTATGNPTAYFMQKNILQFLPVQTAVTSIAVWYVPQPSLLTEQTDEADIPYPVAYHPVLVDGGLYYLFQEEGGFKNMDKQREAQQRWETGKTSLLSYLYTSSGQTFSTFSSA
jgi:hypothetical protein